MILDVQNIETYYGESQVLFGVSLNVGEGEVVSLLGPNGAGKTTTLRILSTALRPSSGTILVDGVDVATDPGEVRRRIGFLSGSTGLYARLTPREIATYFGRLYGMRDADIERRAVRRLTPTLLTVEYLGDLRGERLIGGGILPRMEAQPIGESIVHDPEPSYARPRQQ